MIKFDDNNLIEVVQNLINVEHLEIGSIRIGNHLDVIDIFEIVEFHIFNEHPENTTIIYSHLTFKERLELLKSHSGIIHFAGGLACKITNQHISGFRISKKYMESVMYFTKKDILQFYGKPDVELIDSISFDINYSIDNYILVYRSKKNKFLY